MLAEELMPTQVQAPRYSAALAAILSAAAILASAGPATAATVVGETFVPPTSYSAGYTALQEGSPGGQYTVPTAGVLTSWSFQAPDTQVPTGLKLKVARPGGVDVFSIVGESVPKNPTAGLLNTFTDISIPVQAGDVLGLYAVNASRMHRAVAPSAGYAFTDTFADEPPGGPKEYDGPYNDRQLDVSATLEADCDLDGLGDETEDVLLAGGGCPIYARSLVLETTKKAAEKGQLVGLRGRVVASGYPTVCEPAEAVEVQRRKRNKPGFRPVADVLSDEVGAFSLRLRVRRTTVYRATVGESAPCAAGVSNTKRVKLKPDD